MSWHGYVLIEAPPVLSDIEVRKVWQWFEKRGKQTGDWPPHRTHWRIRPDNRAIILESLWSPTNLNFEMIVQGLHNLLPQYSEEQIRQAFRNSVTIFAEGGTWEESHDAAVAYVREHLSEWESAES